MTETNILNDKLLNDAIPPMSLDEDHSWFMDGQQAIHTPFDQRGETVFSEEGWAVSAHHVLTNKRCALFPWFGSATSRCVRSLG